MKSPKWSKEIGKVFAYSDSSITKRTYVRVQKRLEAKAQRHRQHCRLSRHADLAPCALKCLYFHCEQKGPAYHKE